MTALLTISRENIAELPLSFVGSPMGLLKPIMNLHSIVELNLYFTVSQALKFKELDMSGITV